MPTRRSPFDVALSTETRQQLGLWVCDEIQAGENARASNAREVEYWHALYEQARTRGKSPWPDAADLTSYLASEKVDALHARLMKSVWSDPICTVEGWGPAADRAPLVEEFHQWKAEEERLQGVIDRLAMLALIEPRGLIEVAEGTETRTVRKTVQALLQPHPETGGPIYQDGNPLLMRDEAGDVLESTADTDLRAETVVDSPEPIRTGPVYRLLPYRDSLILPSHARDKDEVYAYFKRFWRRFDEIAAKADAGVYDKAVVDRMAEHGDREPDPALQRSLTDVAPSERGQAQKELWEGVVLLDLDTFSKAFTLPRVKPELRGERWYLVTVHLQTQALLRVQHDDMERSRFVPVILFPRPDRVTEGFSFVGHKLITTIEEHTAVRNMRADRSSMVVNAPIKRMVGALWDPQEQPFGPKAVIDVRDMREIEPFIVPDVTPSIIEWEQSCERTAERLAGINDVASGQVASENRTLGEVQMATEQSFVRMDLVLRRFQEAIEDIYQIRHAIWKRTLAEQPEGVDAPMPLLDSLEGRGVSIDQFLPEKKITAALLDGAFRFKPAGSVADADPVARRNRFGAMMQAFQGMAQAVPGLAMAFASPQAQRALLRMFLQAFGVKQTQPFLGSPSQDLLQQQALGGMPPPLSGPPMGPPGIPGIPGLPPGAPPPQLPPGGPSGPPAI